MKSQANLEPFEVSANSENRSFFVVSGMHRSHTSLLGRMLVEAGLSFHSNMVGANRSNPYGHYEDVDFLELQKTVLSSHGARWFRNVDQEFSLSNDEKLLAKALIQSRFEELGNGWGFKNPQSTLFLDYWKQWPEARFLLIFREPRAVMSSMFRRMGHQLYYRPDAWLSMARAYVVYNSRIAGFREAHGERTYLLNSAHLLANPSGSLDAARTKIGLPIEPDAVGKSVVDRQINSSPSNLLETKLSDWAANRTDVQEVFERLRAIEDSAPSS